MSLALDATSQAASCLRERHPSVPLVIFFRFGIVPISSSSDPFHVELYMAVSNNRVPHNGWFIMENPIKMDDLGVPLFLETSIQGKYGVSKQLSR